MTDQCSLWAWEDINKSEYIGLMHKRYLHVFVQSKVPLTHYQASMLVNAEFKINVPARNGRIAELTQMGYLKKVDQVRCEETNHIVNRWMWTQTREPTVNEDIEIECPHCHGRGKIKTKREHVIEPQNDQSLFVYDNNNQGHFAFATNNVCKGV